MMSRRFPQMALLVLISSIAFCQYSCRSDNEGSTGTTSKPMVVVTTGMVRDLVANVAGDHFEIEGLIGEGVDPHLYRPTASDTGKLVNADLVFYSGLKLEGNMQSAFEKANARKKPTTPVTKDLPSGQLRTDKEFEGHPDPHVWGDVQLWMKCLDTVVGHLSEFSPDHAEEFQNNAEQYRQDLQELDKYAKRVILTIPEGNRYLVTAHDAFGYLADAYGLQVRSVQGISTASEPGVQDINELVSFLVENKIPSIFVEATVNSANIKAVIEGAQQKGWTVKIGGTLYSDSLGTPGTYEGTYIGMMDANITTIVNALGGSAPVTGYQGKLKQPE